MENRDSHSTAADGTSGGRALGLGPARTYASQTVTAFDRWLAQRMMALCGAPPVSIKLWNGEEVYRPAGDAASGLQIGDRPTLIGLLLHPELNFGDAYATGRIVVHGDLVPLLEAIYRGLRRVMPPDSWRRRVLGCFSRPGGTDLARARENIHHHYDLGNEFYRLWLDERMVYTCAYYPRPETGLEEAQVAKMDLVCRKLRLTPGQTVVEAGCGWGSLALHMARHYGVTVRAYNISHQQILHARAQAEREGLTDRVEFVEDDYRNISGRFDAFVSVGMLEHVGVNRYRDLGALIVRHLEPAGLGLIHTIGRNTAEANNAWIERRIFPGSRPPSLAQMTEIFEPSGISVLDVENLRLHYARTCLEWLRRYESVQDRVRAMYDESFARAWRLYLSGSAAAFTTGGLQLFQVVFAHPDNNEIPLTRDRLYAGGTGEAGSPEPSS